MSRKLMEMPTNTRPSSAADAPTCASAKLSQSPILYANAGLLGVRSYPRRALRRSRGRHQFRMLGWGMADRPDLLSRRQAMGLLAGLGAGVIAAACGGGSSSKSASSSTTTRTASAGASSTTASTAACVLTPEVTEGPYYLDLNKVRSDITEGKDGAPLDLKLTAVDATGCTAIRDAAVDVWQCDAGGIYSGFSQASAGGPGGGPGGGQSKTDNQTFLRGTQVTDANGLAEFQTIYPGWTADPPVTSTRRGTIAGP